MIFCNNITFDIFNIDMMAISMTVVGYTVVFSALALMVLILIRVSRIQRYIVSRKLRKKGKAKTEIQSELSLTGDENAAICTALYLYFTELHDEEKYAMTIHKVSKTYSPWSSKIYGVMNGIKN
jgi:Na+-transporting methylmalonyl-CoA/oxaloacetate decarboxylase gamma subunit